MILMMMMGIEIEIEWGFGDLWVGFWFCRESGLLLVLVVFGSMPFWFGNILSLWVLAVAIVLLCYKAKWGYGCCLFSLTVRVFLSVSARQAASNLRASFVSSTLSIGVNNYPHPIRIKNSIYTHRHLHLFLMKDTYIYIYIYRNKWNMLILNQKTYDVRSRNPSILSTSKMCILNFTV